MSAMKKTLVSLATAAAAVGVTFSVMSPAAAANQNFQLNVASCPGTGQYCSTVPSRTVTTSGAMRMVFTSSPAHCSPIAVRLFVDNTPRSLSVLSPGQASPPLRLMVPSGMHKVGVQATGIKGGCNTGHLSSWKGLLNVQTDLDALMSS